MKRREFMTLLSGAAAAWPLAARAQDTNKAPRRIAFFPDPVPAPLEVWRAEMRVLGWIEGRDYIVIQSGFEAGSRSPLDEAAERVVANKPDLICTNSTAYALAMQRATGSIPIVMLTSGYPVEAGVGTLKTRCGTGKTQSAALTLARYCPQNSRR